MGRVAAVVHRSAEQGKRRSSHIWKSGNPCPVLAAGTEDGSEGFVSGRSDSMLMMKARWPAIRTLRGWAISMLQEDGAIRECEERGWMRDRRDPHGRMR
jgi:hypothetical protein